MPAIVRITKHELRIMVFAILSIILASLFMIHPAYAQSPAASIPSVVSPTSPLYTDLLVNNLFHSFSCLAIGQSVIGAPCLTYQMTRNAQGAIQGVPVLSQVNLSGGALGATTSLIGMLYMNPPVRTADYLASVGEGLGIVKEAHAQVTGSGAQVLKPVIALWQVSRNISYVIMIVIFVVIGLMIMFRNKLNPQTVITAQTALPGLVIGLILITFSYFLAGLISDMAFVGTNVVGYYFAAAQGKTDDPERLNLVNKMSDKNILNIFGPLTDIVGNDKAIGFVDSIFNQLPTGVQNKIRIFVGFFVSQFIAPMAGGIPPTLLPPPWGLVIGPAIQLLGFIIGGMMPDQLIGLFVAFAASLALLYAMIKLLFRLISAFLTIIFLTITAPFQMLVASLPGRQSLATNWILNMLANILVFPAVIVVLYFVAFILGPDIVGKDYILKVSSSNQIENNGFIRTASAQIAGGKLISEKTFPLFGNMDLSFINILLAFGALMALPKIPDIVVAAIGRMGQAGQMLGQEISSGVGAGRGYAGQFQNTVAGGWTPFKRGLFGEQQWHRDPFGKWVPYFVGKPGLFVQADKGWEITKLKGRAPEARTEGGSAGAGRAVR